MNDIFFHHFSKHGKYLVCSCVCHYCEVFIAVLLGGHVIDESMISLNHNVIRIE